MIPNSLDFFKNLTVAILSLLLFEGQAQPQIYYNFSSLSTSQVGISWLSQPISNTLRSDCISLIFGLGLHYAIKGNSIFLLDCFEKDTSSTIKFFLYPNPVHSTATLTVRAPQGLNQKVQLQVVDAMGRMVRIQWVTWQDLQPGLLLHMSLLASGIYFLKISSSTFNSVIKIIKI